jgi:hypothetical protein
MIGSYAYADVNTSIFIECILVGNQSNTSFTYNRAPSGSNTSHTLQDGYKVLKFTRRLNTGDKDQKVIDPFKLTTMVMSVGIPTSGNFEYHEIYKVPDIKFNFWICSEHCDPVGGTCGVDNLCTCNPGYWGQTCNLAVDASKGNLTGYTKKQTFLSGQLTVHWTPPPVIDENTTISFALEGQTLGYVAFGFSATGSMVGSDAIVGWITPFGVESVKSYRLVGQVSNNAGLSIQDHPNLPLFNTSAYELNGKTIVKFTRKVFGGNVNITSNTTKFVVSMGEGDILAYHGTGRRFGNIQFTLFPIVPVDTRTGSGAISLVLTLFHFTIVLFVHLLIS